ncbi:GTPase ObgE [Candidatus Kaiserbacteria bacterium CG10_big_fil_rev_8_21_14_0_10_47_16]|uniref:GTPase Obg n=1 Tax=Candidatus Kaiserbacteria bacterium CG10_big_fil_rev_8_21_14_0_10_47_16 TaxID=1974608 RepID=A0A2H0UEW4_9BACT|nr:MAG: GTPase ObgE [Candidatus Kaiserbacteria bacterium CG10_big_fil_rev_8_21_14_0_10_47_16]
MFVDELTIDAKAGKGGDGVVRWLRLRHMPKGGPAGGNGGNGGSVYIRAVRDLNKLSKYTGDKLFAAESGGPGGGRSKFGKNGEDLYIDLPIGSKVTDVSRKRVYTLEHEGETHRILIGGNGGLGNEYFKSSVNRSPEESTKGKRGEDGTFHIELSLVLDAGFIGFPNAGKSTLLNAFTNATSAIGAYPFTTLEPHLGDLYGFILADIPGLIEGASEGKGLGHKFLRHVQKTKMLLHLISLENEDIHGAYQTIRNELGTFDSGLTEKEEWIILTKADLTDQDGVAKAVSALSGTGKRVFVTAAPTEYGLKELRDALAQELRTLAGDIPEV